MTLKSRKLIPIGILGGLLLLAAIIRMNPPEAPQRSAFDGPTMSVETLPVIARDYQIMLQSYGTVQPRTRSILIAQVGGMSVVATLGVGGDVGVAAGEVGGPGG